MKIYTKTGDTGQTSLFDGTRVSKAHVLVDVYGEVDELNSVLGLAMSTLTHADFVQKLKNCQRDLFALGAKLANPDAKKQKEKADFGEEKVTDLEQQIDSMESELKPLTAFILPGGTPAASTLHLARCVCRRAERKLVAIAATQEVNEIHIRYLNRLSDYLFVAARYANHLAGESDIPWV